MAAHLYINLKGATMPFQEDAMKHDPVNEEIIRCWVDLCEKGDRTSPEEYPDHCLITYDELAGYMRGLIAMKPIT